MTTASPIIDARRAVPADIHISVLGLAPRLDAALAAAGIRTVADLASVINRGDLRRYVIGMGAGQEAMLRAVVRDAVEGWGIAGAEVEQGEVDEQP